MMMMMMTLTGENPDFKKSYNLLIEPRTVSNTYAQVARAQSCTNHVQHIGLLSRAACPTKGQLSY